MKENQELETLRFPIGKFVAPELYTEELRLHSIKQLRQLPAQIRTATKDMTDDQLSLPYRGGGWCTRQIVHHLADSHINSFVRFKLALTEDNPEIKAYDQDAWAEGKDVKFSISASLSILDGVHERLVNVIEHMSPEDFERTLFHPEWKKNLSLNFMTALYGWHSEHHLTQVLHLKARQGW